MSTEQGTSQSTTQRWPTSRSRSAVEYIDENGNPLTGPDAARSAGGAAGPEGQPAFVVRSFTIGGASAGAPRSRILGSVWRVGIATGIAVMLIGLAMIAMTSGIAAVVCWPLGAFTMVTGGSVLWATVAARRATQSFQEQMSFVGAGATTTRIQHEQR